METKRKFPKGFLWGAATSAYQVEGGISKNDWALSLQISPAGQACDHHHRFREDFLLARKLGHNAHRLSIEWSRVEPREGEWDEEELHHYFHVLEYLKENGFATFVTLHHFTNPLWVARGGGWTNANTTRHFAAYAAKIAQSLGQFIDFWVTINEPNVYVNKGFLQAVWPPFKQSLWQAYRAYQNLFRAHNQAYQIIHSYYPKAKVGFAAGIPYNEEGILSRLADWFNMDFHFKRTRNDFIGLNHYFYNPRRGQRRKLEYADNGWPIYPKAILEVLLNLKKFNLPIYITENGVADAVDAKRADYIRNYLRAVHQALKHGADVRGYLYWSLLDNYEWPTKKWQTGYEYKFGLIEVDFEDSKLPRKVRASAKVYAQICKNNGLS